MFELRQKYQKITSEKEITSRRLLFRYIVENSKHYNKWLTRKTRRGRKNGGYMTPPDTSQDEDGYGGRIVKPVKKVSVKKTDWYKFYRQDSKELDRGDNAFGSHADNEKNEENEEEEDEESDDDDDDDEEEEDNEDDFGAMGKDEKRYYRVHQRPENTYDLWLNQDTQEKALLNTHTLTYREWSQVYKKTKSHLERTLPHLTSSLEAQYGLYPHGLYTLDDDSKFHSYRAQNIQERHVATLIQLLRINISQLKWPIAYRIFSVLIRIPDIAIQSIWQYGVDILNHGDQPIQTLQFLEWMHSVYASRKIQKAWRTITSTPVFTRGSRNHTAQFSLAWLWTSLSVYAEDSESGDIDALIDRIGELVLGPPFMENGEVWFILAMCHMVKADHESLKYMQHLDEKNHMERHLIQTELTRQVTRVHKYLDICESKEDGDFKFPREYILKSLNAIEYRLLVKDVEDGADSPNEYESDTSVVSSSFAIEEENSFLQALDLPQPTARYDDEEPQFQFNEEDNYQEEDYFQHNSDDSYSSD